MSQRNNDIETTYTHTYSSRFIIDRDPEFGRMKEMGLENYDRALFTMFFPCFFQREGGSPLVPQLGRGS